METPQKQVLTIEQAFNSIAMACYKFVGTREDHAVLDNSLSLIKKVLDASLISKEEKKDDTLD